MLRSLKSLIRSIAFQKGYIIQWLIPEERAKFLESGLDYRTYLLRSALVLQVGEVSVSEAKFLGEVVKRCSGPGPVVEIGTLFGRSTWIMICNKEQKRELLSVDNYSWNPLGLPSEVHFELTSQRLSDAVQHHSVRLLNQDKDEFQDQYSGEAPALVFIDADHSYEATKKDIEWARSIGTGIVCGHDYHHELCPGVVQAVDECGGPSELVETLWVL